MCDCVYDETVNYVCINPRPLQNQQRIWRQVRTSADMYTANMSAVVAAKAQEPLALPLTLPLAKQTVVVPSHGNSVRATLTRARPGASSPGGEGVNKKHDSYARYLSKRKVAQWGSVDNQTPNCCPKI
jgi:hypothetical protein